MLLEKFITALHSLEFKPTAEELADIFWLTAQIRRTMPIESITFSQENPTQLKLPEEPSPSEDTQDTNNNNYQEANAADLYAAQGNKTDAQPLRVPATRYLPHSLKLARALRPLKQRIPSRKYYQLNETATVEQIAQTRLWLPVVQGIPERHFDVVLVIEKSASMVIWQPVINEFRKLLEYQGAFRNVQEWTMEYKHDDLVLSHRHKEMFDPTKRRLILVITDCISLAWYSQQFIDLLTEWSRHHPVAIVQLLPQRMWRGTSLSQALRVNFKASAAHVTNAQLQSDANEFWLAEDIPNGIKMPVITLERYSLGNWAKLVTGRGNDWVTGVIFEKEAMPRETPLSAAIDATDRINRFFAMASPTAQQLARYLAVVPLTLEIMRMVQHEMLPASEQVHLAEVFLGGLLKPDKSEFTEYDFHDGIRALLSKSLSDTEIDEVRDRTTKFINERFGQCLDFRAWLVHPNAPIPSEVLPFAQINAKILKSLGGKYLSLAKQIERSFYKTNFKREYRHVIYVNYADADEEWVIDFIKNLKQHLREQLGEIDENFIWAKYMLCGTDNKQTVPRQHLTDSKYLLVILSNAYLKSDAKKEIDSFKAKENFIVVEHDKVDRPDLLRAMEGYHFWYSDAKERVVRLGTAAVPNDITHKYHQLLDQMARDIVHELNSDCPTFIGTDIAAFKLEISRWITERKDNSKVQASSNTYLSPHIFIYATEEDRKLAEEVQQQLYDKHHINSSLPLSPELGLSPQEIEESIEQDLLNCQHVIIISDKAPPTWVRQKILHCFKIQAERNSNGNKNDMNVVAVFNKPPPEGLKDKLGIRRPNLFIWDCLENLDNCISEFKKIIL